MQIYFSFQIVPHTLSMYLVHDLITYLSLQKSSKKTQNVYSDLDRYCRSIWHCLYSLHDCLCLGQITAKAGLFLPVKFKAQYINNAATLFCIELETITHRNWDGRFYKLICVYVIQQSEFNLDNWMYHVVIIACGCNTGRSSKNISFWDKYSI